MVSENDFENGEKWIKFSQKPPAEQMQILYFGMMNVIAENRRRTRRMEVMTPVYAAIGGGFTIGVAILSGVLKTKAVTLFPFFLDLVQWTNNHF